MADTEKIDTSVETAATDTRESFTSEDSKKLLQIGLNNEVIRKLEEVFKTGKLAYPELDQRALNALKEFPVDEALAVLDQFVKSSHDLVCNKSAFLCAIMKTYRKKKRVKPDTFTKGPNQDKNKEILDRTIYSLDVTTGQRKYGGPPPDWTGPSPSSCCEQDNFEVKNLEVLKVNISVPNLRLFVGSIPKSKSKEEIFEEFSKLTAGLTDVIIYSSPDDKKKNRGFCFLEFGCHKSASLAKRRLGNGRFKVWDCYIVVDWADSQEEPDEETMSKVKVLYAKNLAVEITEDKLKEVFEVFGSVERVKKIKDYAFIHYEKRDSAIKAMESINAEAKIQEGVAMTVSLAKPPPGKEKKQEMLRNRDKRMMHTMQNRAHVMGGANMPPAMRKMGYRQIPPQDWQWDYGYNHYQGSYADHNENYYDGGAPGATAYYDYGPANYEGATNVEPPIRGHGTDMSQGPSRGMRGTLPRGRSTGRFVGRLQEATSQEKENLTVAIKTMEMPKEGLRIIKDQTPVTTTEVTVNPLPEQQVDTEQETKTSGIKTHTELSDPKFH